MLRSRISKFPIRQACRRYLWSTAFHRAFDLSRLNEHQFEQNYYDVIALQKKLENIDWQLAYFARYSDLHFHPDLVGDLVLSFMAPCGIAAKSSL